MPDDVLVVTPTFFPESVGTPLYVTDLVRGLREHGARCRVVTAQPYYPAFRRFAGYGRRTRVDDVAGAPVVRMPTVVPRRGAPAWRAVSEINFLVQVLLRTATGGIRRARTVLAVSPGVPVAVLAGAALRRRGGRLVVVVHDVQFGLIRTTGGPVTRRLARVARLLEVWVLQRADAVTVLSPAMAYVLADAGVTVPIHVVPLWPTVGTEDVEADPDTVLYSGNLGRKQGVDMLLDVAEGLAAAAPSARLVIRGEGPEGESLRADASRRGLGNVVFEPLVPTGELARALARAAVHIVPQLPEGAAYAVPSKIFNILAAGRPVVATAVPTSTVGMMAGEVDAVRTVPPGDVEALVAEVVSLLSDASERRRVGEAGRQWVDRTHGRDRVLRIYLQLLEHSSPASGETPLGESADLPTTLATRTRGADRRGFWMIRTTIRELVRDLLHTSKLDRLLMRRRVARGQDVGHLLLEDRRKIFDYVYAKGVWRYGRDEGALSGAGSELQATRTLRDRLGAMLRELGGESLLDVGCGDFTWMQHVDIGSMDYTGVDIVPSVIAENQQRYATEGRRFLCLDAVSDPLPAAAVVLCREVLFHLSFADGRKVIENITATGARYLIATTDRGTEFNADIRTGDYRMLNLERRPYRFPRPQAWIPDGSVVTGRGLALWSVERLP